MKTPDIFIYIFLFISFFQITAIFLSDVFRQKGHSSLTEYLYTAFYFVGGIGLGVIICMILNYEIPFYPLSWTIKNSCILPLTVLFNLFICSISIYRYFKSKNNSPLFYAIAYISGGICTGGTICLILLNYIK